MLTCFQAGSATCTGLRGKETHKEEEKKNEGTASSFHIQTWWEEKPQFPSLSPQSFAFGVQCCCLLAGCLLFHK